MLPEGSDAASTRAEAVACLQEGGEEAEAPAALGRLWGLGWPAGLLRPQ